MLRRYLTAFWMAAAVAGAATLLPASADAFCGTYVSGGESELFNNATQAVMMRHEQTTVLSMQNNYTGPTEDFAMIVPTPVVLQKENVKTLDDKIFDKLDQLTAPRLVEYWEKDPCQQDRYPSAEAGGGRGMQADGSTDTDDKVTVEAEFSVGEYDVVVLGSSESTALEGWLTDNGYNIPSGAAPYLDPYIQQGSKFFVAKVDADSDELSFKNGQAVLSPLRFHYESDEFKLPVRLGLINSQGKQDLIVNVLAQDQRYQVANYPNATIPTNIEVVDAVRKNFGSFYRALFKETLRQNKKDGQTPVVTEYSWNAATCDPCPGPALTGSDIATLGGDVINQKAQQGGRAPGFRSGWVITRLHARYGKDELGKDLVFEKADPIVGGRERYDQDGNLERGASQGRVNNFQGRYIIRHRWQGEVLCEDPDYGRWGGPPGNEHGGPTTSAAKGPNNGGPGLETDDSGGEPEISRNVRDDIPELGIEANPETGPAVRRACSQTPFGDGSTLPLALVALAGGIGFLRFRR